MIETILAFFSEAIGELLDAIVTAFTGYLDLDLQMFVDSFPFIAVSYRVFQAIGLGVVLSIVVFQLSKFFFGQLAETRDTPIRILIRGAMAVALIYFGGHFLAIVVDFAKTPYDIIRTISDGWVWPQLASINWADAMGLAVGSAAVLSFGIIILVLIAWNLMKLMLEVVERFIMVGLLVYTAPLTFATVASESTMQIFKKWVSMFLGQCALMILSIWSLKVVLSGFHYVEGITGFAFAMRFVMTLAFCKVAQRLDSYMQQLGINVGTTGGNLLDDIVGMGMLFGKGASGSKGSKSSVLGQSSGGRFSGILGGVSNAFKKGAETFRSGGDRKAVFSSIGNGYVDGAGSPFVAAFRDGKRAINAGYKKGEVAKQGLKAMGKGFAVLLGGAGVNSYLDARRAAILQKAAEGNRAFNERAAQFKTRTGSSASTPIVSKDIQDEAKALGVSTQQFFQHNRTAFGAGSMAITSDENGKHVTLDENARRAGITWANNFAMAQAGVERLNQIVGPDDSVAEHLAANYGNAIQNEEYQAAMEETAERGSPLAAAAALMNPEYTLEGNDRIGRALLKNAFGDTIYDNESYNASFKNIRATTIPTTIDSDGHVRGGGRVISAEYKNKYGIDRLMEIHDEVSFNSLKASEQAGMRKIQTQSGYTCYIRTANVTHAKESKKQKKADAERHSFRSIGVKNKNNA